MLDHIVIAVSDLALATQCYRQLGFEVVQGGRNGPTHNALILFADGTYLELISLYRRLDRALFRVTRLLGLIKFLQRQRPTLSLRFAKWLSCATSHKLNGLQDWCLRCEDLDHAVSTLQQQQIDCSDAQTFTRTRPDGLIAEWRLAAPSELGLPFLLQDISEIDIRVPFAEHCVHRNGATGIRAVLRGGSQDQSRATLYDKQTGVNTALFRQATALDSGASELVIQISGCETQALDPNLSCGARIELVAA